MGILFVLILSKWTSLVVLASWLFQKKNHFAIFVYASTFTNWIRPSYQKITNIFFKSIRINITQCDCYLVKWKLFKFVIYSWYSKNTNFLVLVTNLINLKSFSTSLTSVSRRIMFGFNMMSHIGIRSLSFSASFANEQSLIGSSKIIPHLVIRVIQSWNRSPCNCVDYSCKNWKLVLGFEGFL